MAIYDFFLSRNNGPTLANYVGHAGRLFYDSVTGEIRISDGATAGGLPIPITLATASTAGSVKPGAGFSVDGSGTLTLNAGPSFFLDETNIFRLRAGTEDQIGGVKSGNGIVIASDGTINLDTEGLSFVFGDFFASTPEVDGADVAALSSVNADQEIVIASNGAGGVNVIGQFEVYKTNGNIAGALAEEPFFKVKDDGQIRMLVPAADAAEGALEIIGNTSGIAHPPNQSGVILHVTGNSPVDGVGQQCRNYFDSRDSYVVITGRRFNGPASSVTKVLNGETLLRVVGQASTDTGFQTFGPARVDFVTTQDQAVGAQGGEVQIYATANNTAATSAVKVASFNGTTGVTATKFTTAGDVTARNYVGQARNAGTLGAAGTLTIDFATDHNVLVNLTTTATIAFSNITAGKTVTVLVKNATGANRAVTLGVDAVNTSGGNAAPNVNNNRTGVFVYRTFGTASTDVYCEVN